MKEYIVDGQIYQVSDDKLEIFLKDFPNAKLKEETIEPVKPTSVVPSATAENEIALNTELPSEDGSLESEEKGLSGPSLVDGVVAEMKARREKGNKNMLLNKKKGTDEDYESMSFKDDTLTQLLSSLVSQGGGASRIPTLMNEARFSVYKSLIDFGANIGGKNYKAGGNSIFQEFLKPYKEKINAIDIIEDPVEKQKAVNEMFGNIGTMGLIDGTEIANEGLKVYEQSVVKGEELAANLTEFDTTIGEAFAQGNISEGLSRSISAALGSTPFMAQAMIPYVGIPSIVMQEAARASGEAQREGDELDLKLMGYSAVIGASEGLLEVVTKKIGKGMFKNLFGKSEDVVKETLTETLFKVAKDMGAEGLSESATLTINKMAEARIRGDKKAFDNYWLELADTFIIGSTSGGGPSSIGAGAKVIRGIVEKRNINKDLEATKFNNLSEAFGEGKRTSWNPSEGNIKLVENKNSKKFLDFDLKQKVSKGEMTIEQSDAIKKNFNDTQGSVNRLKRLGLTGESQVQAVELLNKKRELQITIDAAKEKAVVETEIQQIEVINEKLRGISKDNAALKKENAALERGKDVATTEEFAEELGFKLIQNTKIDDLQKIAPKGFNAKTDYGFIQGNKIYLNNDIIGETNEVKTASHELLHGILTKSILDGDMTKDSVEKFVKDSFGQKDFDFISKQMEAMGYDSAYLEKRPDEYLTQLYESDMLGKPGAFEKVARFVEGIVSKITLGKYNPTFTNKEDLGIFLREFKQSIETGKMSDRLKQSKFFPTDKDGKIIKAEDTDITALSKQKITPKAQEFISLKKDGVITNESLVDIINSPSSTSVDKFGAIEAVVEANWPVISNAIKFNPTGSIPMDAVKEAVTEQIQGIFPGRNNPLFEGFNKDQSKVTTVLGPNFLGKRYPEILERAKKIGGITQEGASVDSKEAKQVKDTTTEETTERVAEKPTKAKESLRKKIKLTDGTSKKVVDAVVKTFGTKLPPADSKEFKQALQKAFRTELKTIIAKDVLGSRNAYETFLRDNFETIIEALPQDVINKRFRPFAEDTGKREKTKEGKKIFKKKDIVKAEFIKYFLGRDVGTSTKGTRKDALAEALAQEFATDATMETIKRPDVKEKREFLDKTQTTEKISKAISRPKDFAFSKKQKDGLRLFQTKDIFETTENDLAQDDKQWRNLSKIYGFGAIDLKTEEGRKELLDGLITSGTAAQLPEVFWEGYYHYKYQSNNFFATSGEAKAWVKQAREGKIKDKEGNFLPKVKFAKATPEMKAMLKRESYVETVKGNKQNKLAKALDDPAFVKRQDQSLEGLKQVFDIFQNLIQENAETNIPLIIGMLSSTSSNMNHFIRTSSPVRFYEKSFTGDTSVFTEEHTLPASLVAKYLFIEATQNNINKVWPNIERNFFQGALSNKSDDKLVGKGVNGEKYTYKSKTPPGWTMDDNIWGRYFNVNVANNSFGISPNEIMLSKGKSVFDVFPVSSAGYQVKPEYNKSIKAAASKNRGMLPKSVQPLEGVTNNEVLSEMKNLDTQANEARSAFSKGKNLNKDFNDIIEKATGIGTEKQYGQTKARAVGADKGKWDWAGIPPSAQDFVGLTRYFAGKGKKGDETIAWVKENFLDPFARANIDISNAQVSLANDFKGLKKLLGISPKDLNKKIPGEPYTIGNAIRVYTWGQQGMKVPGLSKADQKTLEDLVAADKNLQLFASELIAINKDNGYPKPQDSWLAGTITTDLLSGLNTVVRAKYLKQWQDNVNEVFTEANMNKLEAAFGSGYRDSLENMLGRMKTGSNRGFKGDTLTGRFTDWINGAVGSIMFFNMRSAVLQTISAVNFINLSDNNMFKAAAAFANQPQYWGDVIKLMNSDYLVQRRNGLKINVNEADIAEIAAESKNKAKAFINKLLKLGFLPTQIADSFAIASGGATFYRNRVKSLIKDGMAQKEAEAQAFLDFREIAEESQQSSRPDRISKQQAGPMGRIVLAFANTPAQYARLMQKAASDLKNRRGDDKTNISKIIYYGAIQNVVFNALQQALFAMAFDDEEVSEEKKNKKYTNIVNGMSDSLLRGVGFHGAAISTLKNVIMKLADGAKAQDAAIEMLDISPPVSSKIGKLRSAGRTWDWNKKEIMEKGWSLDNPAYLAAGQVVSAATNVPLDRGIRKLQNLKDASDAENEEWMRVANALGWAKWELEWQKDKKKNKSSKDRKSTSRKSVTRKSISRKSISRKSK